MTTPHYFPASRLVFIALMVLTPLACGGGGTEPGPTVASISVSLSATSVEAGQTVQATATPRDNQGNPINRSVTWSSSNTQVATVAANGLVNAVSAGTASIIATIESVQGQATLTVTSSAPQIGGLTLKNAAGQPLNLSNVAGTIGLDFNLTVPAGTTGGTLIVKIDNVEFARQTVNAAPPQLVRDPAPASVVVTPHIDVNTASVNYTLNNNQLQALPLAGNGNRVFELVYLAPGATQPSASTQANIQLANPNAFTGRFRQTGNLTLVDGKNWSANDIDLELIPIRFGTDAVQSVDVLAANNQPEFGSGALGNVVNVITKTGSSIPNTSTLTRSSFRYESNKNTGANFYLASYTYGSITYNPQTAEPNLSGNCLYTRGTGLIQPLSVSNPTSFPAGCQNWVRPTPLPASLLNGWLDISGTFHHDTKEPTFAAGAFTLATRPQVPDASAYGSFGGFGVLDNHVGASYNFAWGVDQSKITDLGSGIDLNQNPELHGDFNPDFTPGPGNLVTDYGQLPETGATRNYFFKSGWVDKVGNRGYVPLTTRIGNDYTIGNQHSVNLGVDIAATSINNDGGSATYSGPWDGYVFRSSNLSGLNFGFTASSSPVGYAANAAMWGRVFKDFDPAKTVYGEGPTTNIPWWIGSSGGLSLSASVSYSNLMSRSATRYGGTGEGLYTGYFGVVDKGGATPIGGTSTRVRWDWDYTAPTAVASGTGPFASGSQASVQITLADNVGLDRLHVGPIFDLLHGGFDAGRVYVTPGLINVGTGFGGPVIKDFMFTVTDLVPNGLVFYDRIAGNLQSPVFNTVGVAVRSEDLARNLSNIATLIFSNSASHSVPTDPSAIRFSSSPMSVCRGTPCSNGAGSELSFTASWDSPFSTDPLNKFEFWALTSDGRVNFLGKAGTPVMTSISGGFRFSVSATTDMSTYCGLGGVLQLFGLGQSKNRLYWFKPNSFPTTTLFEPTVMNPYCWTARRILP